MKNYLIIPAIGLLITGCGEYRSTPSVQLDNTTARGAIVNQDLTVASVCDKTAFNDFKVVITKNCTNCHQANSALGDFRDYATAFAKKDRIQVRVLEKKDMPMGKKLTAAEYDIVGKWLDAGAPALCIDSAPGELSEQGLRVLGESTMLDVGMMAPVLPDNVKATFSRNCGSCHNGQMAINLLDYNTAFNVKDRIQNRVVVKKDMPMGAKLNGSDLKVIQDWLAAGAPPKG